MLYSKKTELFKFNPPLYEEVITEEVEVSITEATTTEIETDATENE
jgi:hypothetical protein